MKPVEFPGVNVVFAKGHRNIWFDKKDGTPSVRVTSIYLLLKTDKMEKE